MIRSFFLLYILVGFSAFNLQTGPNAAQNDDIIRALIKGNSLTAGRIHEFQKQLEKNPNDLVARASLIGYYWLRLGLKGSAARCKNILWFIRNHSDLEIFDEPSMIPYPQIEYACFPKAKEAWQQVVEANLDNAQILANAASFFLQNDSSEAERLLLLAREIEPDNMEWAERLGQLYWLNSVPQHGGENARKALKYYEIALEHSVFPDRSSILENVASIAVAAGRNDKATRYAKQLLDAAVEGNTWSYGNAVHHGNLVLGLVAVSNDALDDAEHYLLLAGRTPGSPPLNTFGPNMLLAKELLDRGRKKAVLEYLVLCGKFWKRKKGKLKDWIQKVENGGIPNFGGNLRY